MAARARPRTAGLAVALLLASGPAWADWYASSPELQAVVDGAVRDGLAAGGKRAPSPEHVSVLLVDPADPDRPQGGGHRAEQPRYPASVVKLFWLLHAYHLVERGELRLDRRLRRSLAAMIRVSSSRAAGRVVDALTGTRSGPKLAGRELRRFLERRQRADRWASGAGFEGCRLAAKTWWEDRPTPRDKQVVARLGSNRITASAAARALHLLAAGRLAGPEATAAMLDLLQRKPGAAKDRQARLVGTALPEGSRQWNKSGWTKHTCHDAALVELPGGRRLVLVVLVEFPDGRKDCGVVRAIARSVVDQAQRQPR